MVLGESYDNITRLGRKEKRSFESRWTVYEIWRVVVMRIIHGLLTGQVLQRDEKGKGSATVKGTCSTDGTVEARLIKANRVVKNQNWKPIGKAEAGHFECQVSGIPCGGPYSVDLRIRSKRKAVESLTVESICVGDVWFLAGQSNMQGIGFLNKAPKPHPMVRCFYMRDEWDMAQEPTHFMPEAIDMVHHTLMGASKRPSQKQIRWFREALIVGCSPGTNFGMEMYKKTRVPQGLVACAHGGASMDQWSPSLKDEGENSLYGAMLRRYRKLGQPIAGMLWYQGESDAFCPEGYTERMEELVASVREDFALLRLPWVMVQIGRVACPKRIFGPDWSPDCWNSVQEQQRRLPDRIKWLDVVPAVDLELDDSIHLSANGHRILAKRMARCASRLALGNRREKPPIKLKSIRAYNRLVSKTMPSYNAIEVTFSNVAVGLKSEGAPVGFCLLDRDGEDMDAFYRICLGGSKATLLTRVEVANLEGTYLCYGRGTFPVANITDAAGMGLPAFGPVPVIENPGSRCILNWGVQKIEAVASIKSIPRWSVKKKSHKATVCPMVQGKWLIMPVANGKPRESCFLMRSTFGATQELNVNLAFGSDKPFKVWLNGVLVLSDLKCTNPCERDQYCVPATLLKGKNEILVTYDGRKGIDGEGMCLRFLPLSPGQRLPEGAIIIG